MRRYSMGCIAWTHFVVAGVSRTDVGTGLTVATHVIFLLLAGFLIPVSDIPVWLFFSLFQSYGV
jgi:hypothetical protein